MTDTLIIRGAQGVGKTRLADFIARIAPGAIVIDEYFPEFVHYALEEHAYCAGPLVVVTEIPLEDFQSARLRDALVVELAATRVE